MYQSLVLFGDRLRSELVQHLIEDPTLLERAGEDRIGPKLRLELTSLALREIPGGISR